jgi:hypothetical protein
MLMGITHTDVPVSEDGKLLVHDHLQWLQHRRELEAKRAGMSSQQAGSI